MKKVKADKASKRIGQTNTQENKNIRTYVEIKIQIKYYNTCLLEWKTYCGK